ncbi:hypothetical protein B0H13DRAFT_981788 [Mycena leptocephala]|nr:hypothetical protein B0H13DRAFT_981788 [Mycena leptocephala]
MSMHPFSALIPAAAQSPPPQIPITITMNIVQPEPGLRGWLHQMSPVAIAAIVVATVVDICVIVLAIYYCRTASRAARGSRSQSSSVGNEGLSGKASSKGDLDVEKRIQWKQDDASPEIRDFSNNGARGSTDKNEVSSWLEIGAQRRSSGWDDVCSKTTESDAPRPPRYEGAGCYGPRNFILFCTKYLRSKFNNNNS